MQSNLTQLQYQQLQIQQQQQRLAQMMQQKQQQQQQPPRFNHPLPPPPQQASPHDLMKQQQQHLIQMQQQQQLQLQQQQQQQMRDSPASTSFPPPPVNVSLMMPPHLSSQHMPLPASNQPFSRIPIQQPQQIPPNLPPPTQPQQLPPAPPTTKVIHVESETQKKILALYQSRDERYQSILNNQHKRHVELAHTKKKSLEMASLEKRARIQGGPIEAFGIGYRGYYGNHKTGTKNHVKYIPPKEPQGHHQPNKKRKRKTAHVFKFPLEAMNEQAEKEDTLVPIRIELEHEGYKLRDTFTWNLNESLITPEQFAEIMCEDLKLPHHIFMDQISKAIKEQIDDYNLNASSIMNKDSEESIEQKNETLLILSQPHSSSEVEGGVEGENMMIDSTRSNSDNKEIELRTIINLDITVGNRELVDQFEWDISCPKNSPEEFAHTLATELGLGGEFKTAIAHSIREQIHVYIKSLLLVGYEFNSSSSIDDELRHSFLPRLKSILRRDTHIIERFTPSITELSDTAIEKMEKDRMREARRKRRGTRARRGIILPDREPQKTHRTGFAPPPPVVPGGGEAGDMLTEEQLLLLQQQGSGYDLSGAGMTTKRSAALKARMNIAAEAATTEDQFMNGISLTSNKFVSQQGGGMMMNNNRQNWQNVNSSQYPHHHHQ